MAQTNVEATILVRRPKDESEEDDTQNRQSLRTDAWRAFFEQHQTEPDFCEQSRE